MNFSHGVIQMCNDDDHGENSQDKSQEDMTDEERKAYEEWLEMMDEIRMIIDL